VIGGNDSQALKDIDLMKLNKNTRATQSVAYPHA
jgi:hypothetical protein